MTGHVLAYDAPVQLVRLPGDGGGKAYAVRLLLAHDDVREVFRSRRYTVAREQYDTERYYRCGKAGAA